MKTRIRNWAKTIIPSIACAMGLLAAHSAPKQELEQVFDPPSVGTFYLLSQQLDETRTSPPYPFDPYDSALPVYLMEGFPDVYVIADSPEDYQALQALKANDYR